MNDFEVSFSFFPFLLPQMPASRHLFFKASCPTPPWPRAASDDDGASAAPLPAPLPGGAGGEVLEMMAKNRRAEGGHREDFVIWKLEKLQ